MPKFTGTLEDRRREAKRMILESKAEGHWGPHRVEAAKLALAAMDRGEDVKGPASLEAAIAEAHGPSRPDRKRAAAHDVEEEYDSDGAMAYRE